MEERLSQGGGVVGDGGLAPHLVRDLVGDVGTAQRAAVNIERLADVLAYQLDLVVCDGHALDAADAAGIRGNVTLDLPADVADEFVGEVEDENRGVLDSVEQRRVRDKVGR